MTAVPAAEANSPSTGARTVAAPEPEPSASLPAATAAAPSPTNAELPVQGTSPAPEATGPVSLEGFAERIVTHVRMSAGEGSGHVDIQLHPQHLGRVSVSLSVHGNEVTLNLTTDNPAAQHLLSARLPELTLALAQAGMALSQANVSLSDQGKERHSYPERDSSGRVRDEARPVEAVLASWQPSSLHALDLSA
jgi:flagellar hook-length control protein FliK